jgi:hypothetical protein
LIICTFVEPRTCISALQANTFPLGATTKDMKFTLIIIVFLPVFLRLEISIGQCKFKYAVNHSDTIELNGYYFPNEPNQKINFTDLISKIKAPRFDIETRHRIQSLIDSLSNINTKSISTRDSLKNEITYLKYDLNSVFQTILLDGVEFALYKIDSVLIKPGTPRELIYVFSTSFINTWNEDFDSWRLFYNPTYGLLRYEYHSFNLDYEGLNNFILIKNCFTTNDKQQEFITLMNHVNIMKPTIIIGSP